MKYTLLVRQAAVVAAGLVGKVTVADLCLLDYLRGWFFCEGAEIRVVEGKKYVWLRYETAIEELPLLFNPKAQIRSRKNQLSALIRKLLDAELVQTRKFGRALFFRLTEVAVRLTQRHNLPLPTVTSPTSIVTPSRDETVMPGQDKIVTSSHDECLSTNIDETGIKKSETQEAPPLSPLKGDAESILSFWNSFPELPKAIPITRNRARKIHKRLADPWWREHWREGVKRTAASSFLTGNGPHGWRATFDWFLGSDSLAKILEGNYDNRRRPDRIILPSDVKAQIKAVDELIASHPANDESTSSTGDSTKAEREELRGLFRRREELVRQLAGVSRVTRQPGDEDLWWTCPLDELRELIRVERHFGNEQVVSRLVTIHEARQSVSRR
ncbi:MAG TPA: hypothetical protein VKV04_00575 [Verrucomicrobiae bacterium]|nr:hypothetical protein [Verrucomicrobiae bacterium]